MNSNRTLSWVGAGFWPTRFVLKDGGAQISSFSRETRALHNEATGQAEGHSWTFKRSGFLIPRITVISTKNDQEIASVKSNWMGRGIVKLAAGQEFVWKESNPWGIGRGFFTPENELLVSFKRKWQVYGYEYKVEITDQGNIERNLPLLLVLGIFMILPSSQND